MSGTSGDQECPYCGGLLLTYDDWKPHSSCCGECVDCGYAYYTKSYQMTLEEMNEVRTDHELKERKGFKKRHTKISLEG